MRRIAALSILSTFISLAGCSSSSDSGATPGTTTVTAGISKTAAGWDFQTPEFTLDPGQEKYLCYAVDTPFDMKIASFASDANKVIHHFMLSQTTAPEPDGLSECDVLFKLTWAPMYIATTAATVIKMPDGAAKVVAKGGQMVLQLHLLNTSTKTQTSNTRIHMTASDLENPTPVGIFALGTTDVHLPASQQTTLESNCTLKHDVHLFAMLPHMHFLGKRMEIDLGADKDHLTSAYVRDPYDFNDQYTDTLDQVLKAGTATRVRCTFQNDTDKSVTFGESSYNEMCFAVGFEVGADGLDGCIEGPPLPDGGVPRAADAGVCGQVTTSTGVGKACTKDGGQCGAGQICSASAVDAGASGAGICISVGCSSNADCGGGPATCCSPAQGGGAVKICIPEACRPSDCVPVGQ
jgi:hypothetical protein